MPQTAMPILDIFISVTDPCHSSKVQHPLPDLLTVAVYGVLVGADTFEEIELWAQEKLPWLRQYLSLPNGVPSHDTFAVIESTRERQGATKHERRYYISSLEPNCRAVGPGGSTALEHRESGALVPGRHLCR